MKVSELTLKALVAQSKRLRSLEGEVCVRASVGCADALLLDFGMLHPPDETAYRMPEKSLVAECPWRIERRTEVIVGSKDPDEAIKLGVLVCVERRVVQIKVRRPSYMVHLEFSDGYSLWIFPDDSRAYATHSEYPRSPWYVTGRALSVGWEA